MNKNPFESLEKLNRECCAYTQSEERYQELIKEHDAKVRAEALDNFQKWFLGRIGKPVPLDYLEIMRILDYMKGEKE